MGVWIIALATSRRRDWPGREPCYKAAEWHLPRRTSASTRTEAARARSPTRFVLSYCPLLLALSGAGRRAGGRADVAGRCATRRRSGASPSRAAWRRSPQPSLVAYNRLALAQGAARAERQQSGAGRGGHPRQGGLVVAPTRGRLAAGHAPAEPASLARGRAAGDGERGRDRPRGRRRTARPSAASTSWCPIYLDEAARRNGAPCGCASTEDIHAPDRAPRAWRSWPSRCWRSPSASWAPSDGPPHHGAALRPRGRRHARGRRRPGDAHRACTPATRSRSWPAASTT